MFHPASNALHLSLVAERLIMNPSFSLVANCSTPGDTLVSTLVIFLSYAFMQDLMYLTPTAIPNQNFILDIHWFSVIICGNSILQLCSGDFLHDCHSLPGKLFSKYWTSSCRLHMKEIVEWTSFRSCMVYHVWVISKVLFWISCHDWSFFFLSVSSQLLFSVSIDNIHHARACLHPVHSTGEEFSWQHCPFYFLRQNFNSRCWLPFAQVVMYLSGKWYISWNPCWKLYQYLYSAYLYGRTPPSSQYITTGSGMKHYIRIHYQKHNQGIFRKDRS